MLSPMAIVADDRSSRRAGRSNDHILATERHDRGRAIHGPTIIPCRDPTSGIRHAFDLVIPRRRSSGRLTEDVKDNQFI
jgi:hypothetical protein